MEPWYKVTTPQAEVREGRSFNPDEFAIALERVLAGTASKVSRRVPLERAAAHRALHLRRVGDDWLFCHPVVAWLFLKPQSRVAGLKPSGRL